MYRLNKMESLHVAALLIILICVCAGYLFGSIMGSLVLEQKLRFMIHENTMRGDTTRLNFGMPS